jgi:uncharacterized protein YdeI (BOF family)
MRFVEFTLSALLLGLGCDNREALILGRAPTGEAQTVSSMMRVNAGSRVLLSGVMVEKCPVAGCWFRLRDNTGTIKVDTRSAGFVVARVPVNSKLTVSGKLIADGDDLTIEALGVRY